MLLDEVDAAVEAYESACEEHAGEEVDLRAFAPSPESPHYTAVVVELIRVDMEHRWHQLSGSRIETYRALFPEVLSRRECLSQIAFEEFRLRVHADEPVDRFEYERCYRIDTSHWPELTNEVASVYATQHPNFGDLSASDPHLARSLTHADQLFPRVGQNLWGFRLIEELGRGAFGRVYLARQTGLADRLVALKVTAGISHEPIKLAQLQHTHIVPIYSQHGDGVLQGFCMPFLGRTTLTQTTTARKSQLASRSRALVSTIRNNVHPTDSAAHPTTSTEQVTLPLDQAKRKPQRERDQIQSAVRLVQKLATGLQHAHERGIIHCDLKPANILISDAGEPLILDFHIARSRNSGPAAIIGGTLPYMSPEQLVAFERGGEVDARCDIYALGVILYEMLAGALPYAPRKGNSADCLTAAIADRAQPPRSLRELNREISPGLAAIVTKCLAHSPDDRYATAEQLAEDLDHHLRNQPLRYAPDRSVRERIGKWCRRHPRFASSTTIGIACGVFLVCMALAWRWREERLAAAAANSEFHEVEQVLPVLWGLAETESLDDHQRAEFNSRAAEIAQRYPLSKAQDWRVQPNIAHLPANHQSQLLDNLRIIAFLQAELALRDASQATAAQRDDLLKVVDASQQRMRQLDLTPDNSLAVAHQSERLAALQQSGSIRVVSAQPSPNLATNNVLDQRLFALQLMGEHRHAEALPLLEALATKHPDDVALLLQLGNSYRAAERWPAAEGCYTACAALRPDLAFPFYFRGLLHLDERDFAAAERDFLAAIQRDDSPSSHINLALAYRGLANHRQAAVHLERAIKLGSPQARVWLMLAQTRQSLGDEAGAALAREQWHNSTPTDPASWIALGVEQLATDPVAAERSFKEALKLSPDSRPALQNLSHILAERQQQPLPAIALLTQSLRNSPDDALLLGSRAVLQARTGQADAARHDAATALHHAPRSAMAWYQAACVEALLAGDDRSTQEQACAMLEAAVALDPSLGSLFAADSDLQSLHANPRLREIITLAKRLQQTTLRPHTATPDEGK